MEAGNTAGAGRYLAHSPGTGTGRIPGEQAEPMQNPDPRRSLCKASTGGIWSSSSTKQGKVQVLETLSLH